MLKLALRRAKARINDPVIGSFDVVLRSEGHVLRDARQRRGLFTRAVFYSGAAR